MHYSRYVPADYYKSKLYINRFIGTLAIFILVNNILHTQLVSWRVDCW